MKRNCGGGVCRLAALGISLALVAEAALCFAHRAKAEELSVELKRLPYKIVYETHRQDNWELFMVNADGSNPRNLTRTPDVNEIYPHVSPDATKISFLIDEGEGSATKRSVYYMNIEGTGRKRVAPNARWSCWNADGTVVAYLKNEPGPFSYKDGTTEGLFFYELASGKHRQHVNESIRHVYNLCWSPEGNWFLATVHGGLGYKHTNLAIEGGGKRVIDLGLRGCRPDISPDGKKVAWGCSDWTIKVGDLDLTGAEPKVTGERDVVTSSPPVMVYHVDWSPDGRYLAFARGPRKKGLGLAPAYLGAKAEGWNICVADSSQQNRWVEITNDGQWNKEPDWVPVRTARDPNSAFE